MLCLVLINFLMIISEVHGSTKCSVLGACKARCNGTIVDLSVIMRNHLPLQITDFANGNKSEEKGYFIDPCRGYHCGSDTPYSAVCQETSSEFVNCGLVNETSWYLESTKPFRYTLVFTGGDQGSQSTIKFIEDLSIKGLNSTYVPERYPTENNYEFIVSGPCIRPGSCSNVAKPIGIIGITFLSIFAVGVILYLVIGVIIMKRRGATRLELIPNYTFWKDLPNLVSDGCLFISTPCCCWKENAVASYHEIPEDSANPDNSNIYREL